MKRFFIVSLSLIMVAMQVQAIVTIEPYKKERDNAFINGLLTKYRRDFPDAEMMSDLDSEQPEMLLQMADGNEITIRFNQKILMRYNDGKPVGFVRLFYMGNGIGMIAQIAVNPESQHTGHGTQLLVSGVEELKKMGAQQIILEILAENSTAQKMCEKVGFKKNEIEGHCFYMLTV